MKLGPDAPRPAEALALAEPGGFIRLFLDEGEPMQLTISDFRLRIEKQSGSQDHKLIGYVDRLLAAFPQPAAMSQSKVENQQSAIPEPLSPHELAILTLVARGLSNREIGERLFLALDTVKGHNRRIFEKLQVVQHALDRGYEVVGVCRERSAGKIAAFQGRITVIPGFTNDRAVIQKAVAGCDGVLAVLVPWGNQHYATGTAQAVLD